MLMHLKRRTSSARCLRALKRRGLLARESSIDDGRQSHIWLTRKSISRNWLRRGKHSAVADRYDKHDGGRSDNRCPRLLVPKLCVR